MPEFIYLLNNGILSVLSTCPWETLTRRLFNSQFESQNEDLNPLEVNNIKYLPYQYAFSNRKHE